MTFDAQEKLARLRLIRSENVGPITFRRLVERFGSARRAIEALPDLAARGAAASNTPAAKRAPILAAVDVAEREMAAAEKSGARLLFMGESDYPQLLAETEDAPPVISVMGDARLLNKPSLGVVGARNASLSGRKISELFSAKIGAAGFVITSGLARGIDTAAHVASLKTGTVAVVAGGIDVIYPPENEKLYREIAAAGVIVAENPAGVEPQARHFPRRNRIISGLSLGVLVVEAAEKSGSLITARMALEQNREVFAVPGSPLDARAGGTNSLLRDGAHVATSAEDILQVLRSLRLRPFSDRPAGTFDGPDVPPQLPAIDNDLRETVFDMLTHAPVPIDDIIRAVDAPAGHIQTILLELELAGRAERHPGNTVSRIF